MRLVRTLLGIAGAILIAVPFILNEPSYLFFSLLFSSAFALPAIICGLFGAIVSYWKRRFGGVFMLLAGLGGFPAALFASLDGNGGWIFLGSIVLIGCAISAFWHRLPD